MRRGRLLTTPGRQNRRGGIVGIISRATTLLVLTVWAFSLTGTIGYRFANESSVCIERGRLRRTTPVKTKPEAAMPAWFSNPPYSFFLTTCMSFDRSNHEWQPDENSPPLSKIAWQLGLVRPRCAEVRIHPQVTSNGEYWKSKLAFCGWVNPQAKAARTVRVVELPLYLFAGTLYLLPALLVLMSRLLPRRPEARGFSVT